MNEILREDEFRQAPKVYSDREEYIRLKQIYPQLKEQYMQTMMEAKKEIAEQKQKYENEIALLKYKKENLELKEQLKKYKEDE